MQKNLAQAGVRRRGMCNDPSIDTAHLQPEVSVHRNESPSHCVAPPSVSNPGDGACGAVSPDALSSSDK